MLKYKQSKLETAKVIYRKINVINQIITLKVGATGMHMLSKIHFDAINVEYYYNSWYIGKALKIALLGIGF